jgi:hypothetical protein
MAAAQVTLIRREIEQHTNDVLAEAVGMAIAEMLGETEARLTAKIAALEARISEFKFVGQWAEFKTYRAGNFVSVGGQVYHCNADNVGSRPGTDSNWVLAVKSGRDGRDGKPPEPPAPRTTRSHR